MKFNHEMADTEVMGVAGGLFSVWCGFMKLDHSTKSFMKSLILKIGFSSLGGC